MNRYRKAGPARNGNPARIIASPATRRRLYIIAAAAVPLLVFYGVLTEESAPLWISLAASILGAGAHGLAAANTTPAPPED